MPQSVRSRRPASLRTFRQRSSAFLSGERPKFVALCLFVACVFALGGGSRGDIQSLIVLRPAAFLFAAYAILVIRPDELRAVRWPLILVGLLALLAAVQLLPLPPEAWTRLPGRALFAEIARDAGLPLGYRPLTLAPARTLNMALSLCVPLAAVLLVAIQSERGRRRIPVILLVGGIMSALVAVAQVAGLGGGSLYLYRVTNPHFPVGLLANRNHQALLMAIVLILIAETARRSGESGKQRPLVSIGLLIGSLVVLALLLASGSRAALLFAAIAAPAAVVMVARGRSPGSEKGRGGIRKFRWAAAIGAAAVAVSGAMVLFSRAESIKRLWASDALEDYRLQRFPLLLDMVRDHWLAGIGFGAFEGAYKRYETVDALTPFIFNQAHNDWLQFAMEGGVPGLIILGLTLAVVLSRAKVVVAATVRSGARTDFALLAIVIMIAVASVVDYPLRTPIFMMLGAIVATLLIMGDRAGAPGDGQSHPG